LKAKAVDRAAPVQAALVIHPVRGRHAGSRGDAARLTEAVGLAEALDLRIEEAMLTPLRSPSPATLFGSGRVGEIAALCKERHIDVVVVDDALGPVQQRNLEKAWQAKVIDRTGLILEIFGRRARTGEGRLQVEMARLEYERSRLVRTWTHLERQRGGFGFLGGPGESQIEADRRLLRDRIAKLKLELKDVRRTRELQRRSRKRAPHPIVALVGYTNAGKSTLFNTLTSSKVFAESMLFATLDPTLRQLQLPEGRSAILSDTVGFISDLPHELVESFRATLDEVGEADVILHVRDIASPDAEAEAEDVEAVLAQIGVGADSERKLIEVWNKVDLLDDSTREAVENRAAAKGAVAVSAVTGEGLPGLLCRIAAFVDPGAERVFDLALGDGEGIAWLYQHGRVVDRAEHDDRVSITAKLSDQAMGRFEQMRPAG
jgi:GTP-binding protein HflX